MKKILLLGTLCVFAMTTAFGQAQVGDDAPDFTATSTKGDDVSLHAAIDDGAVVLLDFMASWCGPCAASTPTLADIYDEYGQNSKFVHVWALDIEPNDSDADIDALEQTWGKT